MAQCAACKSGILLNQPAPLGCRIRPAGTGCGSQRTRQRPLSGGTAGTAGAAGAALADLESGTKASEGYADRHVSDCFAGIIRFRGF